MADDDVELTVNPSIASRGNLAHDGLGHSIGVRKSKPAVLIAEEAKDNRDSSGKIVVPGNRLPFSHTNTHTHA
jgi:hypothetical protein